MSKKIVAVRLDKELIEKIEEVQKRSHLNTLTQAIIVLLNKALEEEK